MFFVIIVGLLAAMALPYALNGGSKKTQSVCWWIGIILVVIVALMSVGPIFFGSIFVSGSAAQFKSNFQTGMVMFVVPFALSLFWPYLIAGFFNRRFVQRPLSGMQQILIYSGIFAIPILLLVGIMLASFLGYSKLIPTG